MKHDYMETLQGEPIANPQDPKIRDELKVSTKGAYSATCDLMRCIDRFKSSIKPEQYANHQDYLTALSDCVRYAEAAYQIHVWAGSIHIDVGWPEYDSNMTRRCDTTSSTSIKVAS
tara:strand:- start:456 stop:803 length:348 start_codon:yes stop_codon:yes gene_type:complete